MTQDRLRARFRTSQLEDAGAEGRNPTGNPTMGEIIAARFSRRAMLKGSMAATAIAATVGPAALLAAGRARAAEPASAFDFTGLAAGVDADHHVAGGYDAQVLLRWGDPLFPDSPAFDPTAQTAEAQARQFGYNNDYVGFIPIDGSSEHGLLVVNHEYTDPQLMFPGIVTHRRRRGRRSADPDQARVDIEMAAHGGSIVEIRKVNGDWQVVRDGAQNRRITATTPMALTGPAAGHPRLQTAADPTGTKVLGTINNCAGGVTPWGTCLMAEENFHGYFIGELPEGHPEAANYERLGVPEGTYGWGDFHERFDLSKEPNEPNRFGWVVEVDPARPDLDAEEAHRPRPLQARGRRERRRRRRPGRGLPRRRRALRLRLQVRHRRHVQPGRPRRQPRPARRRHALCREVRRRRHACLAAAHLRRRAADRRPTASRARPTC